MTKKGLKFTTNVVSREDLSNPHRQITVKERLKTSNAIDLRFNHELIKKGNGYAKIKAKDPSKRFK